MFRQIILIFSLLVFVIFSGAACTPSQKPMPPEPSRRPAPTTPAPENPAVPMAPAPELRDTGRDDKTDKIAEQIGKIEGVNKAHVILSNSTGYIGLELDRAIEGNKVNEIERKAEKVARETDENLTNVMVTTDLDTVTRIRKVTEGVRGGQPLTAFAREIEEIGRRIDPTKKL